MQELLGPACPTRDEQGSVPAGHSEGVDDPGVHAGHKAGGELHRGHRHPGGEVQEELVGLATKPHAAHGLWVVGLVVGEGQDEVLRALAGDELDPGADALVETVDAKRPGVSTGHEHCRGPAVLGAS